MNRTDLKNYLNNQEWLKDQIEYYEEQMTICTKITATLDGMPHAQNKSNYKLEELMDKLNEILENYKNQEIKLSEVISQLNKMTNTTYRNILYKRYIQGKSYEEISIELNYSYDVVCRYNGYALNEYDKLDKKGKNKNDIM